MPGTEGALSVFWSPDGRSLAFFADRKLKRIDLPGGAAVPLCDVPAHLGLGSGAAAARSSSRPSWEARSSACRAQGESPEPIVTPDLSRGEKVEWPSFLPDGKRFLYLSRRPDSTGQLMLGGAGPQSETDRARACRTSSGSIPITSSLPRKACSSRSGSIRRASASSVRRSTSPSRSIVSSTSGRAMFTTSRNGTIAYHSYANIARLVWVDRTGKEQESVGPPGDYLNVRLSPDGGTVLFERTMPGIGTWDLWTSISPGLESRLTTDPAAKRFQCGCMTARPSCSQMRSHSNTILNLARKRLDTGIEDQLLPNGTQQRRPVDVSSGRTVAPVHRAHAPRHVDIFTLPLARPRRAVTPFSDRASTRATRASRRTAAPWPSPGRIRATRSVCGTIPGDRRQRSVSTGITWDDLKVARDGVATVVSCSTSQLIAGSWPCPCGRHRDSRQVSRCRFSGAGTGLE